MANVRITGSRDHAFFPYASTIIYIFKSLNKSCLNILLLLLIEYYRVSVTICDYPAEPWT